MMSKGVFVRAILATVGASVLVVGAVSMFPPAVAGALLLALIVLLVPPDKQGCDPYADGDNTWLP